MKAGFEIDKNDEKIQKVDGNKGDGATKLKPGFPISKDDPKVTSEEVINKDETITPTEIDDDFSSEDIKPISFYTSPIFWILVLLLCFGALQTYNLISDAFATSTIVGVLWSIGLGIVTVMVVSSLYKEFRSVLYLKSADKHRRQVLEVLNSGKYSDAFGLCQDMAQNCKLTNSASYKKFLSQTQSHFDVTSVFSLYEDNVLKELDEKAHSIIVKRSTENGVIVALSPVTWIDMALTLARSLRMIREISSIYGLQCGLWSRVALYRRVIHNLIFIGMTDLATDAVVDVLGAGTVGKLSASLGKGVAAATYSSRLGYMAVKVLRPLPLTPKVMTLGSLRKELLSGGPLYKLIKKTDENSSKN